MAKFILDKIDFRGSITKDNYTMLKEPITKKTNLKYTCSNQENCKVFEIYEAKTNKTEKRNSQNYC